MHGGDARRGMPLVRPKVGRLWKRMALGADWERARCWPDSGTSTGTQGKAQRQRGRADTVETLEDQASAAGRTAGTVVLALARARCRT